MSNPNKCTTQNNTVFSIKGEGLNLETSDDVQVFVDTIIQMDELQTICLSGNTIGVEAGKALAAALQKRKHKTTLKIAILSDIFTGRDKIEIPKVLTSLCNALKETNLEELDLSDNAFGPTGAEPLIDFLSNATHLKILRLNNNGLGIGGGTMLAKALQASADAAQKENRVSSLREIVCGRNRLEDGSSEVLANAFSSHGTLEVVRMPQNGIRPEGIETIVGGLKACKGLRHLDLQDNTFTAKGSKALAKAIDQWPQLEVLNVSDCLLSRKGGVALIKALQQGNNVKLTHLHMQYNELQIDSVILLTSTIDKHLKQLQKLELNGNRFDAEANETEELIDVLKALDCEEDILDELDDMEELDSDEEEEEEEEEEDEPQVVRAADQAQLSEPVAKEDNDLQTKEESEDLTQKLEKLDI